MELEKLPNRKKIINIRTGICEIKNRKIIEKINKTRSWFFKLGGLNKQKK